MSIRFDLGQELDLEFSRSNIEFAISQPKMVRLLWNEKQTYGSNSKASNVTIRFDLGHDLDLEFSRSNMEFPVSQPKVVWLPRNEKANISIELQTSNVTNGFDLDNNLDLWILKVKHDLDLWPHSWPWPWIFMVKFWNSCITVFSVLSN